MPSPRRLTALGAGFAVLALVAHLWMLDAPELVAAPVADEPLVAESVPMPAMSGCPSGMSACQVPMPLERLALLTVLALVTVAVAGRWSRPDGRDVVVAPSSERDPPYLSSVRESVVLLV